MHKIITRRALGALAALLFSGAVAAQPADRIWTGSILTMNNTAPRENIP